MPHIIGVDVGGTLLRAARFDFDLNLLERTQQHTPGEQGPDATLERLYETIRQVMPDDPDDVAGIGVALPGPLDAEAGTLIAPPNLPFKGEVPMRKLIRDAIGGKVFLGNDADLAGLAEHQRGAGRGAKNMIYITVSTGVGGGIIIDGVPYSGRGQGGEIGHMIVWPDGPLCSCGRRGHLEAVSAGSGIARIMRERIAAGEKSSVLDLAGGDPGEITAKLVGEAAKGGDALASEVVRQAGHYLGVGIASLMMLLNPDLFVLGGGITKLGDWLFEPMNAAIRDYAMVPRYWENTPIVAAQLGDDVGLIGAAALVKISVRPR